MQAPPTTTDADLATALAQLPAQASARLDEVCAETRDALQALRDLPSATAGWATRTATALLEGSVDQTWSRAQAQLAALDRAVGHHRRAGVVVVRVDPLVDPGHAAGVFDRLAAAVEAGTRMRRVFPGAEQRAAQEFGDAVTVDGRPPATPSDVDVARHHLRFLEIAQRVEQSFRALGATVDLRGDRVGVLDALLDLRTACAAVDRIVAAGTALVGVLSGLPASARPALDDLPGLDRVVVTWEEVSLTDSPRWDVPDAATDTVPLPSPRPRLR